MNSSFLPVPMKDLENYRIKSGQPRKKRITTRMRFVVDGFVYHNNVIAGSPPLRYLGCAEHKKSGCRGRATIPVGGTLDQLRVTQQHNHPPDLNAAERQEFLKELKKAVRSASMENATLKKVYETVAEVYLRCCKAKSAGCRARAVMPFDGEVSELKVFNIHNHPKDENEETKQDFLTNLKQACSSDICAGMKLSQIYNSVADTFPDGSRLKPFISVKSSMKRWRKLARSLPKN